ncbi:hypothetical protein PM082_019994 [Marasmius tenuissimus]|nr:hypothetical protein PM082_019994 [Marasmius tenuissimus]
MDHHCSGDELRTKTNLIEGNSMISSEFARLSRSNDPPDSSFMHEQLLSQHIQTSECLRELDEKIKRLSDSLVSLQEERAPLAERQRLQASILHPIRRVPPEILTEVFRICTANDATEQSMPFLCPDDWLSFPGSLDTRKAPWILGQVCRGWREVATSASDLWTQISVPFKSKASSRLLSALNRNLRLQLERSHKRPLTVAHRDPYGGIENPLLLVLRNSHSRWERAFLDGSIETFRHLVPSGASFPLLKTLQLSFDVDHWEDNPPYISFSNTPTLERLTLCGDLTAVLCTNHQIPWKSVIHYASRDFTTCTPPTDNQFLILPKLENIETCVIDTSEGEYVGVPSTPSLELKFLHTLVISYPEILEGDSSIPSLLRWLVLPALRVLRFPIGLEFPGDVIDLLNRSSCELEELVIENMGDTMLQVPGDLARLFQVRPLRTLRTLGIGGMRNGFSKVARRTSDTIFKAIVPTDHQGNLVLPDLRRLILCHGQCMEWTDEVLLEMLTLRRQHHSTTAFGDVPASRQLEELVFAGFERREEENCEPRNDSVASRYPLTDYGESKLMELCGGGLVCTVSEAFDWYEV